MRKIFAALVVAAATSLAAAADPSVDEVLQAYRAATGGGAWDDKQAVAIDAEISGEGLSGTIHTIDDLKRGRSIYTVRLGPTEGAGGFDGTTPWERDTSGFVAAQQGGDAVELAINDAYRTADLWWRPDHGGATIVFQGTVTDSGGRYHVLAVTPRGGEPFEAWFDTATHFLIKVVERQGSLTTVTLFSDYRREGDVIMPHFLIADDGLGVRYRQRARITRVVFLGPQPDSTFAPPQYHIADTTIANGAAATTIPIRILNNHIYGEVRVNGRGPFAFVFDTGARDTITPPLAREIGVTPQGQIAGIGGGEGVVEGGYVNGLEFSIGEATIRRQVAMVLPLDNFNEIEGAPLPGLIGYEIFRRFVVRIDYGAATLTLIDPARFDPAGAGTAVPFVFNGGIPEVAGTIEGIPAKLDIDTGARNALMITRPFAEQHSLRASHPEGVETVDGWGVGGPTIGYVTRLGEVTIGPVALGPVVASLSLQQRGVLAGGDFSANVGGGILNRFVVTFDYAHQILYLKPLPAAAIRRDEFDRSGLWINGAGTGFRVVYVTPGSPAAAAGLKPGDFIVSVDGVPANTLTLAELRQRLRDGAPGTAVTFIILRGGVQMSITFLLRELI